ncbi:MAG: hypothetical protein Q8916_06545 [Bacteroidota bacterium]|nr:hypothetical protein [Bacteroidota bacterium]MDP4230049.1 hypothetical protein [Bacteroidota bacterium]MDP4236043.1 hypothetical protein [Bacteroidota bacterium]
MLSRYIPDSYKCANDVVSVLIGSLLLTVLCLSAKAQEIGNEKPSSISVGVEGGWMRNFQSGRLDARCGCSDLDAGRADSWIADFFVGSEFSRYFSLGVKVGIDNNSTTATSLSRDSSTVASVGDQRIVRGILDLKGTIDVTLSYLFVAPYLNFTPFGRGFFLQLAPEFGTLLSSHLRQIRELANTTIISGGDTVTNIRFQNGSTRETLQDGPVQDVNKLHVSLIIAAGYDFRISEDFFLLAGGSYHVPLTMISSDPQTSHWKISSVTIGLGIRHRLPL